MVVFFRVSACVAEALVKPCVECAFLLWCASVFIFFFIAALRPRKRDGLLATGTEWERDDRVKARPRKPPEKDRRDRGPPPEQCKC